ncbi:bifunctional folylpolyglutamate synthase/dihydrofolate synthase [Aerosakkonema funiforme]|uniref:bifunctional folylpolyglutamate synthase/dihydrofolate synthase n=1 Tax=Aerosakkonema funiforme TaxID=1246630 RepID=UPI0035BB56C9
MLSPENANIDNILKAFQHFGVHLGLERIQQLLADLGNPDRQVRIIHVAGTNGKGSVCAYLSSVLTAAGYRVGRYISPHLIDWNERICLNEKPISSQELQQLLLQVQSVIKPNAESPTQFEVITAAAWLYFAQQKVDVAVIEVGLGGRLDATNVCSPLVTVITSISREHWQVLGPTIADIAREKAGILKPGCPAVIGQLPPEAITVVKNRIQELGCPAIFPQPAIALPTLGEKWAEYQGIQYPLPLWGDFQLANSALAIASLQLLQQQGWQISQDAIVSGMAKTKWLGRVQWTSWKNQRILIDGAHNPAAAIVLRQYVDTLDPKSVTWVMGILSSKDCDDIFKALLRPSDRLFLVPVPDPNSAHPEDLATLARHICPELALVEIHPDLVSGLAAAIASDPSLLVLCGSLYLIGHFLSLDRSTPASNNPHL